MRVLHFSKYDRKGGAALAAYNSVKAQRDLGIDATLFAGLRLAGDSDVVTTRGLEKLQTILNYGLERFPFRIVGVPPVDVRSLGLAGISPHF